MERILMLIVLTLVIIVQFYTISILPIKGNKQLLLGCVVTEEIRNNIETKELIKRFKIINIIIMIVSEVILILGCLRNSELIMTIAIFFAIIVSSISYGVHNTKMRKIKSIMGGLKSKKQVTVFEIEKIKFNKRNIIIDIVLALVFILGNIYFTVSKYDLLPNKIATNFDIMGNATYYSEKNIGTFLSLIISIVFISVIFIFAEYIIRSTKLRIDPRNVERSREGNIKYRNLLSNTMIWAEIVSLLLLTIGNLVLLQVIDMNIIIVSINLICMILLIGVLVIFIIKANKIRFNYKIEKDTVVQKDDDDKWIFGLIYYNKEDPRVDPRNVERSREGNIKYRNLLSNTMIWAEIVSLLLLTIGNLVLLQVIDMNIIIVSINLICMILLIGVLVIFIIKANKIRFNYKIEKDTVVQKDDDDKWIFGLIYYNKEDPRVNVEKRFGIGYTVNAGTPIGMAIYIGTVILLIAVLALSSVAK